MDIFLYIISLFFLFVICLIPILFWGYFFSFSSEGISRNKFFYGILAGGISTLPILGMEYIYSNIFPSLNIFKHIYLFGDSGTYLGALFSLLFLITAICFLFFIIRIIFSKNISFLKYLRAASVYLIGVVFLLTVFFILGGIENSFNLQNTISQAATPAYMGYIFNSLKLVIMYYLIIAFLEEGTKYFAFLSGVDFSGFTGKKGVLFALYIALGFAFFENILYAFYLFSEHGLNMSLISILLYRSIFSLFIHVFASVVLGYCVSKMYDAQKYSFLQLGKYIIAGVIGAIMIHASYDILITLGGTFFIFLYFIGAYTLISKLIFSNK